MLNRSSLKTIWEEYGALIVSILLCTYYISFLAHEIQIERGDLGRFIEEGELILKNKSIISTNFYSYSYPDFKFPNHHWGSSIIFYSLYSYIGFKGIHIVSIILSVITLIMFLKYAFNRKAVPLVVLIVGLFSIPLIAYRHEIRPEIFTALFSTIFFIHISRFIEGKIGVKRLMILLFIYIGWVNIHSYHFLALVFVFAGLMHVLIHYQVQKDKIKGLVLLIILLPICSLINPNFIDGAIVPYQFIFSSYSFDLDETRSIFSAINIYKTPLLLFALSFTFVILIHLIFYKNIVRDKLYISLVSVLMIFAALKGIRNISLFGWFMIPFGGVFISQIYYQINDRQIKKMLLSRYKIIVVLIVVFMLPFLIVNSSNYKPLSKPLSLGVRTEAMNAVDFYKRNLLLGPIFNNYNNAGYLIFGLFPNEKVYTLNKFECYPDSFFTQEYFPALFENDIWERVNQRYNFNVIFFNLEDEKIENLEWLGKRLEDPEWALVYHEIDKTAILVKRNKINLEIISATEINPEFNR